MKLNIKQFLNWVKLRIKKILIALGIIGVAFAAYPNCEIPLLDFNGEIIEFPYTDDNSNENVLIYTDKEIYRNGDYIYMAVKNKKSAQIANLQFFFSSSNKQITDVEVFFPDIPNSVEVPDYKIIKYDCSETSTTTEKVIEKTCSKQEQIGSHTEVIYRDIWVQKDISDFSKQENDALLTKVSEKPKKDFITDRKTKLSLPTEYVYLRVKIQAPMLMSGQDEFFIEIIGEDGAYGHLDPFLSGWAKRRKVTVSNTNIDSDLTHYPLLLTLGTSVGTGNTDVSSIFDELGSDANRLKIAFTKTDGETQLYGEIEKWDDTNETAVIWVSKSDLVLSSSGTTELYFYYDSTQSDNTTYIGDTGDTVSENVWESGYSGVHHMNDNAANATILDATSNSNDLTYKDSAGDENTSTGDVTGKIDSALDFDAGNSEYAESFGNTGLSVGNQFTISLWVNFDASSLYNLVRKWGGSDATQEYLLRYRGDDSNQLELFVQDDTNQDALSSDNNAITDTNWHKVDLVWDIGDYEFFVDNSSVGSGTAANVTDPHDSPEPMQISYDTTDFLNGIADEFRIYSTSTAAWRKADYYNQTDALVSWGAEENAPTADTDNFFLMF